MARSGSALMTTERGPGSVRRRRRWGAAACVLAVGLLTLLLVQGVALGDTGNTLPGLRRAPVNPAFLQQMAENSEYAVAGSDSLSFPVTGYRASPIDPSLTQGMQVDFPRLGDVPTSYDLRLLSRVTAIRNQNPYSVCWAFAALGSLESCLLLPPSPETWDFSEDNMALNAGFDFYGPSGDYPYGLGNFPMATAYLARWGGPVNEADDTYGNGTSPGGLTVRKHVQEVDWIPARASATDNTNLKQTIINYGGVAASMFMTTNSTFWNDSTEAFYYDGPAGTNHAVVIVGWDDSFAASNFPHTPAGNGAFIVKNSYGPGFGTGGYFYVSYYDTTLGGVDDMALFNGAQSNTNYSRVYQYDPLGYCDSFGWDGVPDPTTGWFANVFTAAGTSKLNAVAFYTPAPNATYEVYTGTGFSGTTLVGKTFRTSGTIAFMGYHTVTLPAPVDVTGGSQFVVAVKLTTPGYYWPVVTEEPISGHSSAANASAGQSYSGDDGDWWADITIFTGYTHSNVCLKAFTAPAGPPTVTALTPNFGSTGGGRVVTINGTNFVGAATVTFGGTPATNVTITSSTKMSTTAPAHVTPGTVDVQVNTAGGASANTGTDDFTYMPPVTYDSYRGTDRYDTAIKLSQALVPAALDSGAGLVLAPGDTFQEALCGAPLAAAYGGPVLLTYRTTVLPNNVRIEMQRLAPKYVFCIGLSTTTVNSVISAMGPAVTIIPINGAGATADVIYDMSRKVANALKSKVGDMSGATAIVTRGDNFPDAIGVSPLACAKLWPIILTNSGGTVMHASATATFADLGIVQAIKVGTYATLPPGVTGRANVSGADRYITNANVADWAKTNAGLTFTHTGMATGDKFPDALASGPFLAKDGGLLLLSPPAGPLPSVTSALITTNRAAVQRFTFIAMIEPVVTLVKSLVP